MNFAMLPLGLCIAGLICTGCEGRDTESPVEAPGADTTVKTEVLEVGAAVLQSKAPVEALNAYPMDFTSTTAIWDNRWKRTTIVRSSTRTLPSA
jgi:hypothetical protein